MSEYVANLTASLRAGARLSPNEAARAVLPLTEALAAEHEHGRVRGSLDPAYVAPEVRRGEDPTAATDVWSVGALLFHAMAGHAPYQHSSEAPARLRRAGWLGPLVEMTLADNPADRPRMAEVAAYLRARDVPAGAPEPTVLLPAPPPPPVAAAPAPHEAAAAPAAPVRRRTPLLALVLAALVVVLALVAGVLLLGGRHGGNTAAAPPASTATGPSPSAPSPGPTRSRTPKRPARPTAAQMTRFARSYVATASRDQTAGFRQLTPAYRRASPDYRKFWSHVRHPRIVRIHADRRRMRVTYTYRYALSSAPLGHRSRVETVVLQLVQRGGRLLISGAR